MGPIDRRSFLATATAAFSRLAWGANPRLAEGVVSSKSPSGPPPRRPNVIVMICDDLGYGDLGCYGSKLRTPNLDRMAGEGMRFTKYDSAHPICSASRGALLTGRYSTRTGTKPVYFPYDSDGMNKDETTIADLLHGKGYRTKCVGKWHLGNTPEYLPTSRGFDSYLGLPYSVDMQPLPMIRNTSIVEQNTDRSLLTPKYTEESVQFIQSAASTPFFLYLAFSYPHIPIYASPEFRGRSRQGIYGDAVEEIDWSVGEIMRAVESAGAEEETLILFTGDHGPWYQGSPGELRGRKGTTYEGGLRVPFIARWKEVISPGQVCDHSVFSLDVLPTIARLCDAGMPKKSLDGMDISALLSGGEMPERAKPILNFSGLHGGFDLQCTRLGRWKLRIAQYSRETYVLGSSPGDNRLLARPELYDLDEDPEESYDVAALHPEIVDKLQRAIEEMIGTFPGQVKEAYNALKQNRAYPTTPPGAASRPANYVAPPWHFD